MRSRSSQKTFGPGGPRSKTEDRNITKNTLNFQNVKIKLKGSISKMTFREGKKKEKLGIRICRKLMANKNPVTHNSNKD